MKSATLKLALRAFHAFWFVVITLTAAITLAADPISIDDVQRKDAVSFEKEILPILQKNCLACHSASEKQGDLVLESPRGILKGGDSGVAATAGRAAESLLLAVASHQSEPVMPPEDNDVAARNLTSAELGLLKLWIDQGAKGSADIESLSPKRWQPLPPGVHPVQAIAMTRDGQFVAASRANQIFLYHVASGQLVTQLSDSSLDSQYATGIAHRDFVQSLAFNVDGDLLASGGFREVKLWRRPRDVQKLHLDVGAAANAVAVSPNKQWVAVAADNHAVRLFQLSDGKPGPTLRGHTDHVTSLRFTADNLYVASGSADKSVRFWKIADGKEYTTVQTPSPVGAIALVDRETPTDQQPRPPQYLVVGDSEKLIRVWKLPVDLPVTLGDPAAELSGHSKAITSLLADPERSGHVYSGSLDGSVRRWNLSNGQAVRSFSHGGGVTAIAVSPDGQRLASASDNRTARLFRTNNGQRIAEMRGDVRLKVSQLRAQQAVSGADSRLNVAKRLLEQAEKDLPKKTEAEKTLADSLAEANKEVEEKQKSVDTAMAEKIDAEKAAIEASTAAKSALADKEQAELLARNASGAMQAAKGKMDQLQQALASDPENEQLKQLVASAEKNFNTCQQKSQQLAAAVKEPTQKAQSMANAANTAAQKVNQVQQPYNTANSELKTAQAKQNLLSQQHALAAKELKEAKDLLPLRKSAMERAESAKAEAEKATKLADEALKASEQPMRSIAFSPDGSVLASGGDFHRIHTWDGQTGEAIAAFVGHEDRVRQIAFVDAETVISLAADKSCRIWQLNPEWTLERTIGNQHDSSTIVHRATAVDFSPDSTQLVVASGVPSRSGELHVFNVADGKRTLYLPQAHDDVVYSARFSPDGKRIASGGADKYLRMFDIASSQQLRRFEGHTNYVLGVAWKSDGETIASCAADNTIKLWEAETGDQRRTITQQLTKHVTAVQFVGDSDNIVSSSGDRRVRIHRASNGGIIRNFNPATGWLHCVTGTPDGKFVGTGAADGTVTIYDGTNGRVLQTLEAQ